MPLLNPLTLPATAWSKTGVSAKLIVATIFLALGMWSLYYWLIDGVIAELFALSLDEDTVYAPGYSDANWRHVSVGMTEDDVHRLLGAPQKRWVIDYPTNPPVDYGERWSYSPGDTNFRCRMLLFRAGRVIEKHSEFYLD